MIALCCLGTLALLLASRIACSAVLRIVEVYSGR
jgi:hypothetical protein